MSGLISHWNQTPRPGSSRIRINSHFQAHLRIGKCSGQDGLESGGSRSWPTTVPESALLGEQVYLSLVFSDSSRLAGPFLWSPSGVRNHVSQVAISPRRMFPKSCVFRSLALYARSNLSCLECKRSRVQISAARPNSSKTYRHQPSSDLRFGVQLVQTWTPVQALPAPRKNTAPISWHLSHPRKTCHSRHFRFKLLILFVKLMPGSSQRPDIDPTFRPKTRHLMANRLIWHFASHNTYNAQNWAGTPVFRRPICEQSVCGCTIEMSSDRLKPNGSQLG